LRRSHESATGGSKAFLSFGEGTFTRILAVDVGEIEREVGEGGLGTAVLKGLEAGDAAREDDGDLSVQKGPVHTESRKRRGVAATPSGSMRIGRLDSFPIIGVNSSTSPRPSGQ
jgi:hypothetical protein